MQRLQKSILAPLAAAVALTALAATAEAMDPGVLFLRSDIDRITPKCHQHPNYPVVGRVAGQAGYSYTRVSFVGCFPSYAACDAWRGPVTGKITGLLFDSRCEPR